MPCCAEGVRDLGHDARHVPGRQPQVIARLKLFDRQHRRAARAESGKILQLLEEQRGRADRDADQVGDDRAGGGHLAGASAIEKRVAQRVAVDADRVEAAAHFGQHVVADERASDARAGASSPHPRRRSPIASSLMTYPSSLANWMSVGCSCVDAFDAEYPAPTTADVERQAREHRQLLGRVAAGDVERRVGFGKAQPLRFVQRLRIASSRCGSCG